MNWFKKAERETDDFLIDHPKAKNAVTLAGKIIITVISSFIFAYGFRAFVAPTIECVEGWFPRVDGSIPEEYVGITASDYTSPLHLISGGASGFSQVIIKFIEIFADVTHYEKIITSALYFAVNIPLLLIAWFKISKQFTLFTLLNVGCVSLFNTVIPDSWIYNVVNLYQDTLARCICGGLTTGISSALAMIINTSSGGTDVISIYISERRSTTVGKYSLFVNGCIIFLYVIFSVIGYQVNPTWNTIEANQTITLALYTIIYYFVSTKVVDIMNVRNRKLELQIFTDKQELATVLTRAFQHGCTILKGEGGFSQKEKYVIIMVISKNESKKAIQTVKSADPNAFITKRDLNQVYGRFFVKPIE